MKLIKRVRNAYYSYKLLIASRSLEKLLRKANSEIKNRCKSSENQYRFVFKRECQDPEIEIVDRHASKKYQSDKIIQYVISKVQDAEDIILKELQSVIMRDGFDSEDLGRVRITRLVVLLDDYGGEIDIIGRYSIVDDIPFKYAFYCDLDITNMELARS